MFVRLKEVLGVPSTCQGRTKYERSTCEKNGVIDNMNIFEGELYEPQSLANVLIFMLQERKGLVVIIT